MKSGKNKTVSEIGAVVAERTRLFNLLNGFKSLDSIKLLDDAIQSKEEDLKSSEAKLKELMSSPKNNRTPDFVAEVVEWQRHIIDIQQNIKRMKEKRAQYTNENKDIIDSFLAQPIKQREQTLKTIYDAMEEAEKARDTAQNAVTNVAKEKLQDISSRDLATDITERFAKYNPDAKEPLKIFFDTLQDLGAFDEEGDNSPARRMLEKTGLGLDANPQAILNKFAELSKGLASDSEKDVIETFTEMFGSQFIIEAKEVVQAYIKAVKSMRLSRKIKEQSSIEDYIKETYDEIGKMYAEIDELRGILSEADRNKVNTNRDRNNAVAQLKQMGIDNPEESQINTILGKNKELRDAKFYKSMVDTIGSIELSQMSPKERAYQEERMKVERETGSTLNMNQIAMLNKGVDIRFDQSRLDQLLNQSTGPIIKGNSLTEIGGMKSAVFVGKEDNTRAIRQIASRIEKNIEELKNSTNQIRENTVIE